MALTITQLTTDTDRLIQLRGVVEKDKRLLNLLELVIGDLVTEIQTLAIAADPDAQAYLLANRRFIINNEATDQDIALDGVIYTFDAGQSYCVDKGELEFFLKKALDAELNFAETDMATWVADANVQFYYW